MSLKIPPFQNLYLGLQELLNQVFLEKNPADKILALHFKKNKKWGKRDREFVAQTFYNTIRYKRKIEYYLREEYSDQNFWSFLAVYFTLEDLFESTVFERISNLNDFSFLNELENKAKPELDVSTSFSEDLFQIFVQELGEEKAVTELKALNLKAGVSICANTSKISRAKLIESLLEQNIQAEQISETDSGIKISGKVNLLATDLYKQGLFWIQDANSQKVASFLEIENVSQNTLVIDTCAGAGGKTLHLANLVNPKGKMISMDVYESKLKELRKRVSLTGFKNIETRLATEDLSDLHQKADYVLIDAPCSSLGTIKRHPDLKYRQTPQKIKEIQKFQAQILEDYSKLLKQTGTLVYATCSILPSENEKQIKTFLENNKGFIFDKQVTYYPSESEFDGFYMCRLKKI